MRRATEDRAGAVIHQHEIGDEHRQAARRIERVDHRQAGVIALFFLSLDRRCRSAGAQAFGVERGERRIELGQPPRQRMIGRDGGKARAEQRVGTGGENVEAAVRIGQLEGEAQPLAFADPVFLHQPDLVGPGVERAEPGEQLVGEIGDLQEPLVELPPFDRRARAPAAAVDDLLVRQHGVIDRVPVDR